VTFRAHLREKLRWLAIGSEASLGILVLAFGLLGVRSFFVHNGRDLYFLALVLGVSIIGFLAIAAAWMLSRRRYWGQIFLLLLPMAPFLAIATD
jgi:hypothetical protein